MTNTAGRPESFVTKTLVLQDARGLRGRAFHMPGEADET